MGKYLLIASIVLLSLVNANAQTKQLDSIRKEIDKHPQHDTTRLTILVDYVLSAINTNTSQALPIMQEIVDLSKEIHNGRGVQIGYIYLQLYYSDRGDFAASAVYADTAIQYLEKDTSRYARINIAYLYNNLGGDNYKLGDYQTAIDQYIKAAGIFERHSRFGPLASVYNGLSTIYQELSQPEKVSEYDRKAITAAEKSSDKALIARRRLDYANSLYKQKKYTDAEAYLKKTEPLVKETHDVIAQTLFYQIRGSILHYKKQYKQAIADFSAAYELSLENDDKYQQIALLDPLIKSLLDAGDMAEAKHLNDTLLNKSVLYQIKTGRLNAYSNQVKWHVLRRDYVNAYKFLDLKMMLLDSISSDEIKKKVALMEVRYKVAGKNREIQSLQEEKEIHELQLRQKNALNYILIGSTVSLLIIALLIYHNYRQRQKLQQQRINELETEKQLTATEAILKGEEQERSRLAKDLHDGLGGMLSGIKYSLNNMKENMIMAPGDVQAFEHSIHMLDSSISEMRRVAHNLMPESLLKFGLDEALNDFCREMGRNGMLKLIYQSFGLRDKSIDRGLSVTVYRVVQELLNNVVKHADATRAIVQVSASETQLTITVEDDGKGMAADVWKAAQGIGWKNIRSRVDYHKGVVNMQSVPHKSTSVFIEFPIA